MLISGSPHRAGPTARLLEAFASSLPEGTAVERFDCFSTPPAPCVDCRACHATGRCVHRDLDTVFGALESTDVLVIATPVYNLSFPAPLKALIDRTQPYWAARFIRGIRPPIARPRQAVLLTVSGADTLEGGELLEKQLRPTLTVLNAAPLRCVHYTGADVGRPLAPALRQARKAAAALFA